MRWLALLVLAGCSHDVLPATGTGRATVSTQAFRRADRETVWIATVNNPTDEDVIIDCDEARIRIAAGTRADVLLTPDDQLCDLKNATEYAALPGRLGRKWGKWRCPGMGP